jgi:hypothetical protein
MGNEGAGVLADDRACFLVVSSRNAPLLGGLDFLLTVNYFNSNRHKKQALTG